MEFGVNKTLGFTSNNVKPSVLFRNLLIFSVCCGERGIRTPGTVARTPHFECGPIDHSGISP